MARRAALTGTRLVAVVTAVVAVAPTARAQSVRYPPDAADADREAESHSALWESALDPDRAPYEELVRDGRRAFEDQSERGAHLAIDKLTDAIRRVPGDPRAYGWRGEAYLVLHDWAHCADDLAAAEDRSPAPSPDHDRQELELGICQGRAGRFAAAEQSLVHTVERIPRGETWMQLGEVRIALGKLDEAIDALDAALDATDGQTVSLVVHWLLASAYDRARRPTNAQTEAQFALARDITLGALVNPPYPWVGRGEGDYLMGLAYSITPLTGAAIPEYALLYFRHYLATVADGPWRRRALEHVRALSDLPMPQAVTRDPASSSIVDVATLRPALEHAMPALRACVAKQPTAAYGVSIVVDGARTPETAIDRPRYAMPRAGATADLRIDIGEQTPGTTIEATRKCLEPLAARIPLPTPKDRDTYYRISFVVTL